MMHERKIEAEGGTYIDAISARLANTSEKPHETARKPQMRPAVPPSSKANPRRLFLSVIFSSCKIEYEVSSEE